MHQMTGVLIVLVLTAGIAALRIWRHRVWLARRAQLLEGRKP